MLRPLPPPVALVALVAVLLVAGLLPYWGVLHWLPWSGDALKWVARGSTDVPTWLEWDFASKHFVGYRPLTALSFTIDQWLGGYEAVWYRATDLGFYLLSGAVIFGLYRQLTGDRSVLGLLPVLLVFAHPTTEDIVPESARRSYLMATTFGLGGAIVLCRWGARPLGAIAGAALLGMAVLSNEVAFVLFPLVPWFVSHQGYGFRSAESHSAPERRRQILASLPTAVVLVLTVALRYAILGTFGGYQRRLFAFVKGRTLMWHENTSWEPHSILGAAWSHTVNPIAVTGSPPLFPSWSQPVFGVLMAVWIVWIGLARPLARRQEPRSRVSLGLMAWMLGSLSIVVLSQTWFWRQAYSVVIPLGMLVTFELGPALVAVGQRQFRQLPTVILAALLCTAVAWNGPLVSGLHRSPYLNVIEGTPLAHKVQRLLEPVPDGSHVYLVAPLRATGGHLLRMWGEVLARPRKVTFHLLGHLQYNAPSIMADVQLRKAEDGTRLHLGRGMLLATAPGLHTEGVDKTDILVSRFWKADAQSWVIALGARGAWAVRATEPPAGVLPFDLPLEDETESTDEGDLGPTD